MNETINEYMTILDNGTNNAINRNTETRWKNKCLKKIRTKGHTGWGKHIG